MNINFSSNLEKLIAFDKNESSKQTVNGINIAPIIRMYFYSSLTKKTKKSSFSTTLDNLIIVTRAVPKLKLNIFRRYDTIYFSNTRENQVINHKIQNKLLFNFINENLKKKTSLFYLKSQ